MSLDKTIQKISRGSFEIINLEGLQKKIIASQKSGKPLAVKAGFDPTSPDIHLGHVVLLRKLRQFQDLGHQIDFLVGDFTALVGDPSGRNKLRPAIDTAYIRDNAKTYTEQAFKILDKEKTNVVFNSSWLNALSPTALLALTACSTVAQMLVRNDFKERFDAKNEISIMEFIYPLLQGFDSYVLGTDIELGGTDQKFNLLMGRQIQEALKEDQTFIQQVRKLPGKENWNPVSEPQIILMTPLLEGIDGVQKMSKSLNNYIGINESSKEIFGKIMSISDSLMMKYFEILTEENLEEIKTLHPKEAKIKLAQVLVTQFYDASIAKFETESFEKTFAQGKNPEDVMEYRLTTGDELLMDILFKSGIVKTKNEFRRLIKQGAISFQEEKIKDENWKLKIGVLKIGKRRFLKLVE